MNTILEFIQQNIPATWFVWVSYVVCVVAMLKFLRPALQWSEAIVRHLEHPDLICQILRKCIIASYITGAVLLLVLALGMWSMNWLRDAVHDSSSWEPKAVLLAGGSSMPKYKFDENRVRVADEDLFIVLSKSAGSPDTFEFSKGSDRLNGLSVNGHLVPALLKYYVRLVMIIGIVYLVGFGLLAIQVWFVRQLWGASGGHIGAVRRIQERRMHTRFHGPWRMMIRGADGAEDNRAVLDLSLGGVRLAGGKPYQRGERVELSCPNSDVSFAAEVLADAADGIRLQFRPDVIPRGALRRIFELQVPPAVATAPA